MFSRKILFYVFILVIFSIILFSSCNVLFGNNTGPFEISVYDESFLLSWDHNYNKLINDGLSDYYRVYYREHGRLTWTFLSESSISDTPQLLISNSILDFGIYDFAVSYVDEKGFETEMHSSLDSTAKPAVGWYVNWTP
ncbi:hypothetical protein [Spirochaeta isovalerica]|uniref:Fibronectin type-III domain-containing protein n=1 Tax=Spirochaeta isovalerica TaxID=150 RepID=A0A841R7B6_9SPIO|nr:hypothetical protein [Spirochaeta isovalerica]MBB6479271.1 hypothetical protein [Spirochaeta isovalerica]